MDTVSKATLDFAASKKALADAQASLPAGDPGIAAAQADVTTKTTALTTATDATKASDGDPLIKADFTPPTGETDKHGLFALEQADIFNILCLPPYALGGDIDASLISDAGVLLRKTPRHAARRSACSVERHRIGHCRRHENRHEQQEVRALLPASDQTESAAQRSVGRLRPVRCRGRHLRAYRHDRGVWKAPAGLDATLVGVSKLSVQLNDAENGQLNPLGINCLRSMAGRNVWGARTLQGDDRLASE